ncbi:hypothetical protein V2J09_021938 [Rumex salicifolius]
MEGRVEYYNGDRKEMKSYLVVFLIQSLFAGMILLQKAVFDLGMNTFVFLFYRQAMATAFLAPIALYFEWKTAPRLSFLTFCKIFIISLVGITMSLDVYGVALIFTSATLASASSNCLPAVTFFLAVLFRLETWKIKSGPGLAKLVGIATCIGGSMVLALYKGVSVRHLELINHPIRHHLHGNRLQLHGNVWIKGVFLMLASNILYALWIVFQGPILKGYSSRLLYITLSCFLSTLQSFVVAIAIERDPSEWKLGWNVRLVSVAYCGVVVTGVAYYLQSYVIDKKGPVFLTLWTPLCFLITTFFSYLFLGEDITLGSILGGILLVGGLYSVMWAKNKEERLRMPILPEANLVKEGQENACNTTSGFQNKPLQVLQLSNTTSYDVV